MLNFFKEIEDKMRDTWMQTNPYVCQNCASLSKQLKRMKQKLQFYQSKSRYGEVAL